MIIWEVNLMLVYNKGKWNSSFTCDMQSGDYELDISSQTLIQKEGDWFVRELPMKKLTIENVPFIGWKVAQGYDRQPTTAELKTIKYAMQQALTKHLYSEKRTAIRNYNQQIQAINNLNYRKELFRNTKK